MVESQKTGTIWLTIVSFLWGILSIVCLGLAVFFIAFYDSPIDPKAGMGFLDYALIGSVLSFPVICLLSSLGIWFLKNRSKGLASFIALLPVIPLVFILFIFTRPGSPMMKDSEDVNVAAECTAPDIGDGLVTTGCGTLQIGVTASGTFNKVSEAHNWEFSAEMGPTKISIENDGNSCPHMIVLDPSGKIIEGFEDENSLRLCPSGLTTTGFFQFDPPTPGIYTLRLFSPDASGSYWLKIE